MIFYVTVAMAAVTVGLSLSTFDTWGQSEALNILVLIVLVGVVGISEAARLWAVHFCKGQGHVQLGSIIMKLC